jgi:hypothetical protein
VLLQPIGGDAGGRQRLVDRLRPRIRQGLIRRGPANAVGIDRDLRPQRAVGLHQMYGREQRQRERRRRLTLRLLPLRLSLRRGGLLLLPQHRGVVLEQQPRRYTQRQPIRVA